MCVSNAYLVCILIDNHFTFKEQQPNKNIYGKEITFCTRKFKHDKNICHWGDKYGEKIFTVSIVGYW